MRYKILLTIFILFIASGSLWAQGEVEMADTMRSNGKIYVVVTVLSIVMTGLIAYLIHVDRKVSKIEKKLNK